MSKIIWKADKKVRVYEIAHIIGLDYLSTLNHINDWSGEHFPALRSSSSSLTLSEALRFIDSMTK